MLFGFSSFLDIFTITEWEVSINMQKEPAQQRKVIALGHSLAITLPDNWCSQNNVNKGDQVSIYSHEESLSIYPMIRHKNLTV